MALRRTRRPTVRRPKARRPAVRRRNARGAPVDHDAQVELVLYAENNANLYRQQGQPIILNLAKKLNKGVYNKALAVKLWGYLAESAAKAYAKEFSDARDWSTMFSPATRRAAAEDLESRYREEVQYTAQGLQDIAREKATAKKRKNPTKTTRRKRAHYAKLTHQHLAVGSKGAHRFPGERRRIKKAARKAKVSVGTRRRNASCTCGTSEHCTWHKGTDRGYKVVRMYLKGGKRTIATGLTLEQAQRHCKDPETSSSTAKSAKAKAITKRMGPWFDGYEHK